MCGRYSFSVSKKEIQNQLPSIEIKNEISKSYNIAPTQMGYVIANNAPDQLQTFRWGLIPYWSKDTKIGSKLVNARKEGIADKPSFRRAIREKRCLILADSFYEWRTQAKEKIPYRIQLKDKKLLVLAGIWDTWKQAENVINSFSIITTPPNEEMKSIHNRMPVILMEPSQQRQWLETKDMSTSLELLQTIPDNSLTYYRVSTQVNSPRNNNVNLHNEIPEQPTLFD